MPKTSAPITKRPEPTKGKEVLSMRQELFVLEYLKDFNGAAAAARAGYSPKTSNIRAMELLKVPAVKARVKREQAKIAKAVLTDAEEITRELKYVAFSNIQDYIEQGNEIVDISTISRKKAAAVKMIKKTVTTFEGGTKTTIQIELHDKLGAIDKFGRHVGYFQSDNDQKKPVIRIGFEE